MSTEAGKSTKITMTPGDKSTVCFNGLGRILNQGTAGDHLQQIDIESLVAGEARSLRIIVDDVAAADPDQTARAPDVRPGPRAQVAGSSRPEGLLR